MAEPGSASNDAIAPAPSSSSTAALPDWEMLSMSMSASALGKPDAGSPDSVNPHPENPNPQIGSSFSQGDPTSFQENPNADAPFASDAWARSLHASANRDGSSDIVDEPFTEGWNPHLSASSGLYGYGADRGYGEQNRQDEALLSSQGTETYYDSNASMVVPKELSISAKEDAGVLSYARCDDVEFELASPKTIFRGGRRARRSSRVMWSIAVTTAMVGIAILGHRWRLACRDNEQLRLELSAKDEKLNDLLYQVNRLKDIVGGHRVPVARSSSA